jgi:hypothetical protein
MTVWLLARDFLSAVKLGIGRHICLTSQSGSVLDSLCQPFPRFE